MAFELKEKIFSSKSFREFAEVLKKKQLKIKGSSNSLSAFITMFLVEKLQEKVVFLTDSVEKCEKLRDDLVSNLNEDIEIFLPRENYPYCSSDIDSERKGDRLNALDKIYRKKSKIVLTTFRNLFEKLPAAKNFKDLSYQLKIGDELDLKQFINLLADYQFKKVTSVENIGEFSHRGSIFDIYPFSSTNPIRIELFDTEIESIRYFDISNQRKIKDLEEIKIYLSDTSIDHDQLELDDNLFFTDLFTEKTIFIFQATDNIADKYQDYYENQIEAGFKRRQDENKLACEIKYFSVATILEKIKNIRAIFQIELSSTADYSFNSISQESYRYDFKSFLESLKNNINRKIDSYILCDNPGQKERFIELLEENLTSFNKIKVLTRDLHEGFILPKDKIAVYTDHQIFGRIKRAKNIKKYQKAIPLKELKRLNYGDFVVHTEHGIGQFLGLEQIRVGGSVRDVVKLLYKNHEILYVKLDQIHNLEKFSAKDGYQPTLSKIGGKQFERIKERTKKSIKSIAEDLIKIYAKRKGADAFVFPKDNIWQTEMEASFEFEDTIDQKRAVEDAKKDMETQIAMDRLVCGDVGFGKTEVGIRIAFKAVNGGKQVAVLAPTTILVHQHYENFKKRLIRYPVKIDYLSRFKTKSEQLATLEELKEGKIDIIIGTHRLLSEDVKFKDLGLLVVDEEQRFGVKHKERIKSLKVNIDILTLTATPIPRTLHMSLLGVRDLSIINTPPVNRLPIKTEIHLYSENIIFEAIMKEYDRGGQVFIIHNRVESMLAFKTEIEKIVPNIKISYAHGQMKPKELEKIMMDFIYKKFDVLITTTIIENGVDIPNVNTLIVDRADMFGLSQLYQLRGRIGRSARQAYAYLLTPPPSKISEEAKQKLQTLAEYTDLGAGFQIAMRDLEIRGAGNLLGKEQSGFIENVGFEMYKRILEEAVNELKTDEFEELLPKQEDREKLIRSQVNLKLRMFIPEDYVENNSERVELYRRLMDSKSLADLEEFKNELNDRFGKEPQEVQNLLEAVSLSILGGKLFIKSINLIVDKPNWYIKVLFDPAQMENNSNLQKALLIQKAITKLDIYHYRITNGGEMVFFYPSPMENDKMSFIKNILNKIHKKITKEELGEECIFETVS